MECDNVRKLLDAYVDGEVDLMTSLDIEGHLHGCAECSQRLRDRQTMRAALKSDSLYFKAPANLQRQIHNSLPRSGRTNWTKYRRQFAWVNIALALVASFVLVIGLFRYISSTGSGTETLAEAVLDSHIRSLIADHLTDVTSTDQHTVKPWFDGRVDFSPIVIDLVEQGFPLIGGRLDYLDHHEVSALVYRRNAHIINLFIWQSTSALDTVAVSTTLQGYHLISWVSNQTTYWAVSDVELSELQTFVQLIQQESAQVGH